MKLSAAAWLADDFDFWSFDRLLDDLAERGESLEVDPSIATQVEIRAQRVRPRRNAESSTAWFDRALDVHRELHDTSQPRARAALDHALDTWQWTLRLDAHATARVQLAALLHAHSAGAVAGARVVLERARCPSPIARDVFALVAIRDERSVDPAIVAVHDADVLSFLALDSARYLAAHGFARTQQEVTARFARLSPAARRHVPALRLTRTIARMLADGPSLTAPGPAAT